MSKNESGDMADMDQKLGPGSVCIAKSDDDQ